MAMPNAEEYFLNAPLYRKYKFDLPEDLDGLVTILEDTNIIDCYCIDCNKNSTFKKIPSGRTNLKDIRDNYLELSPFLKGKLDELINSELYIVNSLFSCSRNEKHVIAFFTCFQDETIYKLGQFPSLADLEQHKIKKYRNILPDYKYEELSKGVGLSSHGVGIGSFVYLRRIFEYLIDEAYLIKKKNENEFNNDKFNQMKIKEKIKLLENYLPQFLVDNREIYSILSKGIHELNEIECLELHPDLLLGIELILDEKLFKAENKNKIRIAKNKIKSIASRLK